MAIRDHFRNDVLLHRAAQLQELDTELAEVERELGAERAQDDRPSAARRAGPGPGVAAGADLRSAAGRVPRLWRRRRSGREELRSIASTSARVLVAAYAAAAAVTPATLRLRRWSRHRPRGRSDAERRPRKGTESTGHGAAAPSTPTTTTKADPQPPRAPRARRQRAPRARGQGRRRVEKAPRAPRRSSRRSSMCSL